jgi:HK97 gp10 family phage protein
MLDIKVVRKKHKSYPEIFKAINKRFLPIAGVELQKETVRIIRAKRIVDSGRLRDSITFKVSGDEVRVGTNVEYAPYLEYGTYKTDQRPYLRPALDGKRKFLVKLWADIYEKVFRALGV